MRHAEGTHYVMCNWNERTLGAIIQLHSDPLRYNEEDVPITVVTQGEVDDRLHRGAYAKFFYNVDFLQGDPTDANVLEAAGVHEARAVLVLADTDELLDDGADARTFLTFLALEELRNNGGAGFRCVLEILGDHNVERFRSLLTDTGGLVEVLPVNEVEPRIYSQALRTLSTGRLYFELLSFTRDSCELYRVPAPRQLVGSTVPEACRRLRALGEHRGLLVGLGRRGATEVYINPNGGGAGGPDTVIEEDHDLLMLAYQPPELDELLEGRPTRDAKEKP